jgi:hypothetical protein
MVERVYSADGFSGPVNGKQCKITVSNLEDENCEVDKEEEDDVFMIGRTGTKPRSSLPGDVLTLDQSTL